MLNVRQNVSPLDMVSRAKATSSATYCVTGQQVASSNKRVLQVACDKHEWLLRPIFVMGQPLFQPSADWIFTCPFCFRVPFLGQQSAEELDALKSGKEFIFLEYIVYLCCGYGTVLLLQRWALSLRPCFVTSRSLTALLLYLSDNKNVLWFCRRVGRFIRSCDNKPVTQCLHYSSHNKRHRVHAFSSKFCFGR